MTKIKVLLIFLVVITMTMVGVSCTRKSQVNSNPSKRNVSVVNDNSLEIEDSAEVDDDGISMGKSLNEIRFGNFEEKDWYDNEYIRALRRYVDDLSKGKVDDEDVLSYRNDVKGKFVVVNSEQSLGGGLYILIVFVDKPENIFRSWVYSFVDEGSETITGYEVRLFNLEKEKSTLTKEQLLEAVDKYPELKLW